MGRKGMSFIEQIKERARKDIKTIVLPEATDIRTLTAVDKIGKEGFAKVILIGKNDEGRGGKNPGRHAAGSAGMRSCLPDDGSGVL